MTRELLLKVLVGALTAAVVGLGGWIWTLNAWKAVTEMRLSEAQEQIKTLENVKDRSWRLFVAANDERNVLRHELGMAPIAFKDFVEAHAGEE